MILYRYINCVFICVLQYVHVLQNEFDLYLLKFYFMV